MEQRAHISEAHSSHAQHHFSKATDALKHDHRVIEKVLAVLEGLVRNPSKTSLDRWEKAVDFIRNFADKCHHLKEEKVLFPALERHGISVAGGPIGVMLVEHEEGRAYARAMAEALAGAPKDPDTAIRVLGENATAYLRLLRQHIAKEDDVLFEMADEALTQQEQEELVREFEEHETREIGTGVHERYLKIVEEISEA